MITVTINFELFVWYAIGLAVVILFRILFNKFSSSKISRERRIVKFAFSIVYCTVLFFAILILSSGTGWVAVLTRFLVVFVIFASITFFFDFVEQQIKEKEKFIQMYKECQEYQNEARMYRKKAVQLGYKSKLYRDEAIRLGLVDPVDDEVDNFLEYIDKSEEE